MTAVIPIRTIHGRDAAWALQARPGDPVPDHPGHFVREYEYDGSDGEIWIRVQCSCGEMFGGALNGRGDSVFISPARE